MTSRERIAVALAIVGISLAYAWSGHFWVDPVDEGYFVDLGQRVLDGALPYRDFTTYYTPGIFYLFAIAFKLFGTNLLVIRYLMAGLRGACALLLYGLTRRVAPGPLAWLPFVLVGALDAWPVEPEPHPSWPAVVACLVALECVARHLSSGRLRWLVFAGAAAGIGYFFKQNVGAFTALGVGGYVLLRPRVEGGRLLRAAQLAFVIGSSALITLVMHASMDALAAGALWLPVVLTLSVLMYRATRDSPVVTDGSVLRDTLTAASTFALVTLAWLGPLLVAIGPAQTPLGLFVGDVNQAAITTRFADFTAGIPPLLLAAIWVSAVLYVRRRGLLAAVALSLMVVLLPIWHGPRDTLTADPALLPVVTWLDVNLGTLHLYLPSIGAWAGVAGLILARGGGPFAWYVLFGTLANLELYPRSDTLHTIVASPTILVAATATLAMLGSRLIDLHPWRRFGIMVALLAVPVAAVAPQVAWRVATIIAPDDSGQRLDYQSLGLERAPVVVPRHTAEDLRGLVEYLQARTPPGEPVFAYPVIPLVNFLADRPNPTAFDHYLPDTLTPEQLQQAVAELQAASPQYVVWDHLGVLLWETDPANRPVSDYIWRCYQQVATFRLYLVLERRADVC